MISNLHSRCKDNIIFINNNKNIIKKCLLTQKTDKYRFNGLRTFTPYTSDMACRGRNSERGAGVAGLGGERSCSRRICW